MPITACRYTSSKDSIALTEAAVSVSVAAGAWLHAAALASNPTISADRKTIATVTSGVRAR
jgi:hypothetical protein